jgi:mono/diheme cytochrome c family protein
MRVTKIIVLTLFGVFTCFLLGIGLFFRQGFSARNEPSNMEARLARLARSLAIPRDAKTQQNPFSAAEIDMEVKEHFVKHCAVCHAADGSGNTVFGRNMYPRASDLRRSETQNLTDGELHFVISNGVRLTGMPGFGAEESAEEIWRLVPFLRRIPKLSEMELMELRSMPAGNSVPKPISGHSGTNEQHMHQQ